MSATPEERKRLVVSEFERDALTVARRAVLRLVQASRNPDIAKGTLADLAAECFGNGAAAYEANAVLINLDTLAEKYDDAGAL